MGLIASTIFVLLFASLIFVILELILEGTLDISLIALLYNLSYDFSNLEMTPKQTSCYGGTNRYITISGIRSKKYNREVSPIDMSVGFNHNKFVLDSLKRNRLNLKTKSLIALELVQYETDMKHKEFNDLFNDLEDRNSQN